MNKKMSLFTLELILYGCFLFIASLAVDYSAGLQFVYYFFSNMFSAESFFGDWRLILLMQVDKNKRIIVRILYSNFIFLNCLLRHVKTCTT